MYEKVLFYNSIIKKMGITGKDTFTYLYKPSNRD